MKDKNFEQLSQALTGSEQLKPLSKKDIPINNGFLRAILERENVHTNHSKYTKDNDISQFEYWYNQYHTGIFYYMIEWIDEGKENKRRSVTPLGMFDNLKDFAHRLHHDIPYDKYVSTMIFGGEKLCFFIYNTKELNHTQPEKDYIEKQLCVIFLDINQVESSNNHYEPI